MSATSVASRVHFSALGYVFDVSADDPDLLVQAVGCIRDLRRQDIGAHHAVEYRLAAGHEPDLYGLHCDGERVLGDVSRREVLGILLWHVNAQATQRPSDTHVVLHAAAATRNGRAIVLPAPMESGKTTTVSGLVQAGFGYLTDEAAAISLDDLHVEPFTKSLAVDNGSWEVLHDLAPYDVGGLANQWQIPVSSLPTGHLAERATVAFVVLPRYVRGSETRLDPISRGTAVVEMSASTFQFLDFPERNVDALARVASASDCFRLTIGALPDAVALIEQLMEQR